MSDRDETSGPTTTQWQASAFDGNLAEYLDPAWTSEPVETPYGPGDMFANQPCVRPEDTDFEGYVSGKVVVVSADRRQLIDLGATSAADLMASSPDQVGTVVVVWEFEFQTGVYLDGGKALRPDWGVRLIDFARRAVVGEGFFRGDSPPRTKYEKGDLTGDVPAEDLAVALTSRRFAAPFEASRARYLDPAWMDQTPEVDYELAKGLGKIDTVPGRIIVVSADTGQLLRSTRPGSSGSEPGPPDWGLSWATSPDEVGTVVIVWAFARPLTRFVDGVGYREDYKVRVIDWATRTVIGDAYFYGESPPTSKSCAGDRYGASPWPDLMESLRSAQPG